MMKKFLMTTAVTLALAMPPGTGMGSTGNNFTMLDSSEGLVGGANDVEFTWDGSLNTNAETALSNATTTSNCPFFGLLFEPKAVFIYGPGEYTFDTCNDEETRAEGTCGPLTMNVGPGQIGAHMLVDWGVVTQIDIVSVWNQNELFSNTLANDCNNEVDPNTVWDLASTDADGDGIPGVKMVDGPFIGFSANYNLSGVTFSETEIPPSITLTGNTEITLEQGSSFVDPGASAFDPQDGDLTSSILIGGDAVDISTISTYLITYDVVDSDDNSAQQITRTVHVAGREPVITLLGGTDITLALGGGSFTDPGVIAEDIKDGDLTSGIVVGGDTVDITTEGIYSITYDVVDSDGNQADQLIRTVTVTELYATSTSNNNFTMLDTAGATVPAGANDMLFNWDGTLNYNVTEATPNATLSSATAFFGLHWEAHHVTLYGPGTYTFFTECGAGDAGCGIQAADAPKTLTMTVQQGQIGLHLLLDWGPETNFDVLNVWDINKAFGPSEMYTEYGGDPATIWHGMSSDFDGDGTNGLPMVDGPFIGFSMNFNVMGIMLSEQNIPPLITLFGESIIFLEKDESFADPGVAASDPTDGDLTASIITGGDLVDTSTIGTFTITYDVTDSDGNAAHQAIRVVHIMGPEPEISLLGKINMLLKTGESFTDPGATANDLKDGDLTTSIVIGGDTVDTASAGTFIITYDVIDYDNNNAVQLQRTVTVAPYSTANNFTMLDSVGAIVGGGNDLIFYWDGTFNSEVDGAVINGSMNTEYPLFGINIVPHDIMIFGPGTYLFYTDCAPGDAGCGEGEVINMVVGENQIGVHLLVDWGISNNTDVINVWSLNEPFSPSEMYIGGGGDASTIWEAMSSDADGDGINGVPMVDGPFLGFSMNFNINGISLANYTPPNNSTPGEKVDITPKAQNSGGCSISKSTQPATERADLFFIALFMAIIGLRISRKQLKI